MKEEVILVDYSDRVVGSKEKLAAHYEGHLHRAFSVFVFNSSCELLLQRRSSIKYHSAGLWSNTCCGHPRPGEDVDAAAHRRLVEEMGFDCKLKGGLSLTYDLAVGDQLYEHEYNHILIGSFDGEPRPRSEEVSDWNWVRLEDLANDLMKTPSIYTSWLAFTTAEVGLWLETQQGLKDRLAFMADSRFGSAHPDVDAPGLIANRD
jgi:isopentenyl-diphosphate Delta-isomerase